MKEEEEIAHFVLWIKACQDVPHSFEDMKHQKRRDNKFPIVLLLMNGNERCNIDYVWK